MEILNTKLFKPEPGSNQVFRPRLLDRVKHRKECKFTLLAAPAGYGKTSLLSEWINQGDISFAWLSLDQHDNDLNRFLTYLLASLQSIHTELDDQVLAPSGQVPDIFTTILIQLLNQVVDINQPFVLVLDDYHRIQNQQIHQAVGYLLENLPPNMRLVIATRIDPPLQLAKLRAQGVLCEIRAEDLRFRDEEAVAYFNQNMKLGLSSADIAVLTAKTEGWIAGLQLAAISLQNHPDKSSFINTFAGDDRYIADYLVDEALARQPPTIKDFLRQTAILDRLGAALCNAITGRMDSQNILNKLEQMNLFLVPLDHVRNWYRYHHLFQDMLLHRLKQNASADEFAGLHRRASDWYLSNNMIIEAIHHAFEADDLHHMVHLIETNIFTMLDQGGIRLLLSWFNSIPHEFIKDRPWLNIARGLVLVYAGELEAGASALNQAEKALYSLEADDRTRAEGYVSAIQAYVFWIRGMGEPAGDHATQALALISQEEHSLRAFATMVLGASFIHRNNYGVALQKLQESNSLARIAHNPHILLLTSAHLVYLMIGIGQFSQAEQLCREILAHYPEDKVFQTPAIAQIYTMMGELFSMKYELDQALEFSQKGLEISKQWDQIDTLTVGYIYLIETMINRQEFDQAATLLAEVKVISLKVSPWFRTIIEETEAKIHLAAGNLTAAARWAADSGLSIEDEIGGIRLNLYRTYARVLLAEGRISEASRIVDRLIEESEMAGAKGALFSLLPMKSLILSFLGEQEQASKVLDTALELAASWGYKRGYVQLGENLIPLLHQAVKGGSHPVFAIQLIEAITTKQSFQKKRETSTVRRKISVDNNLIESLSSRELEVLLWIAEGYSNQEIATELVLSIYTVKSHVRHIFSKLGVKNRTEAVTRARLLGLLPTD